MTIQSQGQFNTRLRGFVTSATNARESLQALLDYSFQQAVEHENLSYLTKTLQTAIEVRSIRTKSVKDYVSASLTNIKWSENKEKVFVFTKKTKGVPMEYTANGNWWEFNDDGLKPTPDFDLLARAKSLMTSIDKVIKGEAKLKEGQTMQQAEAVRAQLAQLLA